MINVGNLDVFATLYVSAPARGKGGEVLTTTQWQEREKLWLGRKQFGGKALPLGDKDVAKVERVYESWFRPTVVPGTRIGAEGIMQTVVRVDPVDGRAGMLIYTENVIGSK